jgi:hypothetical protein
MSDLKVRPPKEKSRSLAALGMTTFLGRATSKRSANLGGELAWVGFGYVGGELEAD